MESAGGLFEASTSIALTLSSAPHVDLSLTSPTNNHQPCMRVGIQHIHLFLYRKSPMNYFHSLLPSNSNPTPSSRPTLDQRPSEDLTHLTPPPRNDLDDTDPIPFIPEMNDTTSLNQLEPGVRRLPRVLKHHSYTSASSSEALEDKSRSVPVTPTLKSRAQSPRRRNSVPARRFYQSTNTLVNSPETRSLNHDEREISPDEVVLIDAAKGPKLVTRSRRATTSSDAIQEWLSDTEQSRSPCLDLNDQTRHGNPLTLSHAVDSVPGFDDPNTDMLDDYEGFAGAKQLERTGSAPPLLVPLEIRLRRPSKELQLRRRSLPFLKQLTLPLPSVNPTAEVLGRISLPELLSQKSASAGPAITHAWTNRYLSDETVAGRPENTIRRISSTLQIVQSRDSIYEVIWEDSLAAAPATQSRRVSATNFGPDLPKHPFESTGDNVDQVTTTMAAWHWSANTTPQSSPTPSARYFLGTSSSLPALLRDDTGESYDSNEQSIYPTQSVDSSEIPGDSLASDLGIIAANDDSPPHVTTSDADTSSSSQPSGPARRHSIQKVVEAANRTPSPVAHIGPSAISGKQRHELLGNRKVSDFSNADDPFAGHRDSLVLAHKRIFHEQIEKIEKALHSDEAPDPRVDHLKAETWHMRRASVGSSSLSSSLTSASAAGGESAEHGHSSDKGKGKAKGILVHEDGNGKRHRGEKHIHVKDVDEEG